MSTGRIIDSLELKGFQIGGAKISDHHANIIVNTGTATASDVERLLLFIEDRVYAEYGFTLEREIILVGSWEDQKGVRF